MQHKRLTDRTLKSLKPAPKGKVEDHWDLGFPKFGVRVSDTGRKTFVLMTRYPGSSDSGAAGSGRLWANDDSLTRTRRRAGGLSLSRRGSIRRQRKTQSVLRNRGGARILSQRLWKISLPRSYPRSAEGATQSAIFGMCLLASGAHRPITDITDLDVLGVTKAKAKGAPVYARNLLALLKRFFAWAVDQRVYELNFSPCERIKPRSIFGERVPRQRKLTDAELFALWRAASRMPYPYGPAYRLLLLSGLRLNEVADAKWSEFDKRKKRWVIPAARMKAKNSRARDHAVPLGAAILEVIDELPKLGGDYVFSNDGGKKPAWIGDKIKKDLDSRMLLTLRALAKVEGEKPAKAKLENWTNHDLRRNVRSGMSQLRIPDAIAEAVLAHTQGVIAKTYNVDDLFDQKAEALAAWAGHLRSIVEPSTNVVSLAKARA